MSRRTRAGPLAAGGPPATPTPSPAALRRLVAGFIRHPSAAALAAGCVLRDQAQERSFHGPAAAGEFLDLWLRRAFAGVRWEVECVVSGGGAAAITFTFHGRHAATFMGLPATGQEVAVPMVLVLRLAGALVTRADLYYNAGTLLRQMGLGG
jgi:hypothetical protein